MSHATHGSSPSISGVPAGAPVGRPIARGDGWSLGEYICDLGPHDPSFEEQHERVTISAVVEGSFQYRTGTGEAVLYPGALMLGNAGACFECGHEHGRGDRCIAFQYEPALFEEIAASAAGSYRFRFPTPMLPALPQFAAPLVHIDAGLRAGGPGAVEEYAIALAEAVATTLSGWRETVRAPAPRERRRVARVLRHMVENAQDGLDLAALANMASMSKCHFLRTFRRVAGVTPHQFLLGLRLRRAAVRLRTTAMPVADIAYGAGFGDLSTFNAHFRRLFGVSPGAFRGRRGPAGGA